VRGSPLIRFFILALALAATAAGLARVTSSRDVISSSASVPAVKAQSAKKTVPFRLVLSAPAAEVVLTAVNQVRPTAGDGTISGTLEIDTANPSLALTVQWKNPSASGEHRFAKLILEAPGQDTLTHVFDADGDIDELLELPLPK
jgi:hypothetical protein